MRRRGRGRRPGLPRGWSVTIGQPTARGPAASAADARLELPRDPSRPATRDPPTSRRCSTAWPSATTSPTTCCRSGQDRRWRTAVVQAVDAAAGRAGPRPRGRHRHLERAVRATPARVVVPVRLQLGHARGRQAGPAARCRSSPATATRLPFADDTFDAVTISFGLRNIVDPDAGLREMLRVTRPGGRLVVCEFSSPTWAPFRTVYIEYLMRALPAGGPGGLLEPGRLRLPGRVDPGLAGPGRPRDDGRRGRLARGGWRNLSGGIVALHHATR